MIKIFNSTDKVFLNNGEKILQPIKSKIHCEDNGDFSSIDERSTYSNIITFLDRNNQQVALTYDRLVVVDYYYTSQTGPDYENQTSWSETEYYVVPAGTVQYDLGNTVRIRQEDMGINRFWQDEWYSVHVY